MNTNSDSMATTHVASRIRIIRGVVVLFASDLAALYGVEAGEIATLVDRQSDIFPGDFVFRRPGGEFVFNEQGAAMLAAQFSNTHSVVVGIAIMRAFALLRRRHPPSLVSASSSRFERCRAKRRLHARGPGQNRKSET
jgi:hypothetical protein